MTIRVISAIAGLTLAIVSGILANQPVTPLPLYFAIPAIIGGLFTCVVAINPR